MPLHQFAPGRVPLHTFCQLDKYRRLAFTVGGSEMESRLGLHFLAGKDRIIFGRVGELSIGPLIAGLGQVCLVHAGVMVLFEVMAS